jgi:hypothetical protein
MKLNISQMNNIKIHTQRIFNLNFKKDGEIYILELFYVYVCVCVYIYIYI